MSKINQGLYEAMKQIGKPATPQRIAIAYNEANPFDTIDPSRASNYLNTMKRSPTFADLVANPSRGMWCTVDALLKGSADATPEPPKAQSTPPWEINPMTHDQTDYITNQWNDIEFRMASGEVDSMQARQVIVHLNKIRNALGIPFREYTS